MLHFNLFLLPDEDKEEDEGDDGEGEHHDPPEQPGARLAAVHAVAAGEVQPVWGSPGGNIVHSVHGLGRKDPPKIVLLYGLPDQTRKKYLMANSVIWLSSISFSHFP